jgi:hypothetical protein
MKIKIFKLIVIIWIANLSDGQSQIVPEQEYGKWGLLDLKTDRTIAEFEYDEIRNTYLGFFIAKKSLRWGVLNNKGNTLIPFEYDDIRPSLLGYLIVQKDSKKGVIDTLNNTIIDLKYQEIDHFEADSTALVKLNDDWFYMKNDKKVSPNEDIVFYNPDRKPIFKKCKKCSYEKAEMKSERDFLKFVYKNLRSVDYHELD